MQLFVVLAAGNAPDAAAWTEALAAARTPARLSEKVDLSNHTGFLPVVVDGKETGFYFSTESYSELATHHPSVAKIRVVKPVVYSLSYGGDLSECAAVFYSASVLVSKFGGTAFEPQGGVIMSSRDLLDAASQCQAMARE